VVGHLRLTLGAAEIKRHSWMIAGGVIRRSGGGAVPYQLLAIVVDRRAVFCSQAMPASASYREWSRTSNDLKLIDVFDVDASPAPLVEAAPPCAYPSTRR
jgi:hypothetical protein